MPVVNRLNYIVGLQMECTDQNVDILSADCFSLFDEDKQSNYHSNKMDLFHTLRLR